MATAIRSCHWLTRDANCEVHWPPLPQQGTSATPKGPWPRRLLRIEIAVVLSSEGARNGAQRVKDVQPIVHCFHKGSIVGRAKSVPGTKTAGDGQRQNSIYDALKECLINSSLRLGR